MGKAIDLRGPPRLKAAAVRKIARDIENCRLISDDDDFGAESALAYMIGDPSADVARVNIYCQTGSVGTCRVLNGQVRQIFSTRCTLKQVKQILRNPPRPFSLDPLLIANSDGEAEDKGGTAAHEDTESIRKDIELADIGITILMAEAESLRKKMRALEEAHERLAAASREDDASEVSSSDDDAKGREYEFHLPEAIVSAVEQFLGDSISDPVKCMATNGQGTAVIYRSGEWAYTSEGLPKALRKALKGRKPSDAPPRYVSLGTEDRYFMSFRDGTAIWYGPSTLDKALDNGNASNKSSKWGFSSGSANPSPHQPVSSVAFGSTFDTFVVVFKDGSWEYNGKGMPEGLVGILRDRGEKADLSTVTLGPRGEWFLRTRNGKMYWGNASEEFDGLMEDLEDSSRSPFFVDFGDYGSYFVSHDRAE